MRTPPLRSLAEALLAALLAAAPVLASEGAPSATTKSTASGPVAVGKPAPRFGGFDVTGRVVLSLDKLRLKPTPGPVLLTFGASFCKPCREGLPRLKRFAAKHPEVRLVLVAVEPEQTVAAEFAQAMGLATALHDKFEVTAKAYGVAQGSTLTLPRTFLIAADGRVGAIYRTEGTDLEDVLEVDLAALVSLPAAPPAAPGK